MSPSRLVIAVDGPAAAGKGTLARRLAECLGFAYLDTGLLYRAVGAKLFAAGNGTFCEEAAIEAAEAIGPGDLEQDGLRSDSVAAMASRVAAVPEVRRALLGFQRRFAENPPGGARGAVLDGRDIGSVVCPDATVKLFVTASEAIRVERRLQELQGRGLEAIHGAVLRDMRERDARDASRNVAPLRPSEDAFVIDTTDLDKEDVLEAALQAIRTKCPAVEPSRGR